MVVPQTLFEDGCGRPNTSATGIDRGGARPDRSRHVLDAE